MTDLPNTTQLGGHVIPSGDIRRDRGQGGEWRRAGHVPPATVHPDTVLSDTVSLFLVKPDRTCVAVVKVPAVGVAPKVVRFKGRTFLRDDVRTFLNGLPISPLRDGDIYVEVEAFRVDDNVAAPGDSAIVVPQDRSGRCIAYGLVAGGLAVAILHAAIAILSRVFA